MYKFHRLPPNYGSNQLITIDKELQKELDGVMSSFKAPCRFVFGYGSGVFEQAGYSKSHSKPQIDIILGVTYPSHFHSINMRQNPQHYSWLRLLLSDLDNPGLCLRIYCITFSSICRLVSRYNCLSTSNFSFPA